jgi:hypothetical protein
MENNLPTALDQAQDRWFLLLQSAAPSPECRDQGRLSTDAAARTAPFFDFGRLALVTGDDIDFVNLHL